MTHASSQVVGLDFGTTNSAMALATPEGAVLATFQDGNRQTTTFRSVLYFDPEDLEPTGKPRASAGPEAIAHCVDRLLSRCGVVADDVDSVFLTGGSCFVPAVRRFFAHRFGAARLRGGEELTAVAKGLALHALAA